MATTPTTTPASTADTATTATSVEARFAELGLTLPTVSAPLAAYVPAVRTGNYIYTSGQLPLVDGELAGVGIVGQDLTAEDAAGLAQICALNALAAAHALLGDLDQIRQVVRVTGFVASSPGFTQQPAVVNGASEVLVRIFGDRGVHARSAVGVAALPINAPVEVELILQVN